MRSVRRARCSTSVAVSSGRAVLGLGDGDAQAGRVVLDAHRVAGVHVDEGRDVEVLVHGIDPGLAPPLRTQRVEAALAVRVVDLDDDDAQAHRAVATEVEAGRVELVAEDAGRGDEGDAPARRVVALLAQVLQDRGPQVRRRRQPVIAVAEGEHVEPVAAEEAQAPGHRVDLGEVEGEVEDVVLELVLDGPRAPVTDLAVQEVRPHARPVSLPTRPVRRRSLRAPR